MSELTEALSKILNWLSEHRLTDIALFKPGLSDAEIDNLLENVPLRLPQEIRELYQWKNGTMIVGDYVEFSCIFETWAFYPLEIVIDAYKYQMKLHANGYRSIFGFDSLDALNIFFCVDLIDMGYVVVNEQAPDASMVIFQYCKGGDCSPIIKYANLTKMMLTIADYYENAYYINDNGDLTLDYQKGLEIWRKHNSYRITEVPNLLF